MFDADRLDALRDAAPQRTRRGFVRSLVNLGVGAGLASALEPSVRDAADAERVPVVYAYARPDPTDPSSLVARTKWVPGDWYAAVERAWDARRTLLDGGLEGVVSSFVVPGALDDATASVAFDGVSEDARDRVRDAAADLDAPRVDVDVRVLDGHPARHERDRGRPSRLGDPSSSSVPGGLYCGSPTSGGTLAPAMYSTDDSGEPVRWFATANHLYGSGGTKRSAHRGEPLYLRDRADSPRIGEVDRGYPNEDVVRARPVEGFEPASRIEGAEPSRVAGQFTRWGLADLRARGEPLTKVGALGGRTTGEIKGVAGITCFVGDVCKGGQLKWGDEDAMTDGDSGSVAYHPDPAGPDDQLLVAGFNNARTWWPGDNYTWGTAAYHVHDRYGLHF